MRAIEAKTFSGYVGLQQIELPKPQPAKDRVLVRITAAGVTTETETAHYGQSEENWEGVEPGSLGYPGKNIPKMKKPKRLFK